MNRVTDIAEECNIIPPASSTKAAFIESVSDGNISNRGGEEQEDITLVLSRELALAINPKRADLTGSLILYGLYTWQVSKRNPFGHKFIINGKPACYRSLRELVTEYPWLQHNSILKALRRAEKALKGEFIMQVAKKGDQEQLHFLLSDKLIKQYKFGSSMRYRTIDRNGKESLSNWKRKKNGFISLQKSDAVKYGLVEALLISNLRYVIDPDRNVKPLTDEAGNIYRQLSPVALTRPTKDKNGEMKAPLPVSSDTITRALDVLKTHHVIHEHALQKNFYTLASTMKLLNSDAAKVTTHAAKVTTHAAKVTTHAAKVTTQSEVFPHKMHESSMLQMKIQTSDRNTDCNPDGKCFQKKTLSLRSNVSCDSFNLSSGAKKLNDLISQELTAYRQKELSHPPKSFEINDYAVYEVEDEYKCRLIGYQLIDEFIPINFQTGKAYTRKGEIDYAIDLLKKDFRSANFPYKTRDITSLRQLFIQHPLFNYEHFQEIWQHIHGGDIISGHGKAPEKAFDFVYWARRIKSLKSLVRYFPQLIREWYAKEHMDQYYFHGITGEPMFDYRGMPEPYFSIAFAGDVKTPVMHQPIRERVLIKDRDYWFAEDHPYCFTGDGKPCYDIMADDIIRPVYYDEYVGNPTKEVVEHEHNPITWPDENAEWMDVA